MDYLRLLAFGSMTSMLIGLIFVKVLPPFEEDLTSSATDQGGDESLEREETYRPTNYVRRRTSSDIGARAWSADPDDLYNAENEDEESIGRNSRDLNSNRAEDEREGLLGSSTSNGRNENSVSSKETGVIDITGWKLVRNPDFILLFAIMALISGAGLLLINNVGTITRTLYEYNKNHPDEHRHGGHLTQLASGAAQVIRYQSEDDVISTFLKNEKAEVQQLQAHQVSVISVGNASGRIVAGESMETARFFSSRKGYVICPSLIFFSYFFML